MRVECPGCLRVHTVADSLSGRMGRCPCGTTMLLPRHDDHPPGDALGALMDMQRRGYSDHAPTPVTLQAAEVLMVAAPFGVASKSRMMTSGIPLGHPLATLRWRLQPGCFRACLKDVTAGTHDVKLLADHDDARQLGTTGSRTLAVWADDYGLWAAIPHAIAEKAKAAGLTALSPGMSAVNWEHGRDDAGPVANITEAMLFEVSFVADGNFPATGNPLTAMRRQAAKLFLASAY